MGKIKRYKNVIERFLSGDSGQRFFNIAYSIGAAIVIWGALFKILHLPGGDLLLAVGMGTEVIMFILTAFDRPPREPNWDEILPALAGKNDNDIHAYNDIPTDNKPIAEVTPQIPAISVIETVNAEQANAEITSYIEQMQTLNRNIAGLNTIFEIQLRSVSSQLEAIESVNRSMIKMREMCENTAADAAAYGIEAQKLTNNLQKLNRVYGQMLNAMTLNMRQNQDSDQ